MSYKKGVLQTKMAMKTRKYEPPKTGIAYGNMTVDALIKPEGNFLSIEIHASGSECGTIFRVDIPEKIVEREMSKF